MPIDFDDPGSVIHDGETIPINTQAKYDAGLQVIQRLYVFYGVEWSDEAADAYEQRVRNGQTLLEIVTNTIHEYDERMSNTPGAE